MKKVSIASLILIVGSLILGGCAGSSTEHTDTVFFDKDNTVSTVEIGTLDDDHYDLEEFEEFVAKEIDDFVSNPEEAEVKLVKLKESEGLVTLEMKFTDANTYSEFNGVELFSGTIAQALDEGYDFEEPLYAVEKGSKLDIENTDVLTIDEQQKVVIIKNNTVIKVDGKITAVSGEKSKLLSKNSVQVEYDTSLESPKPVYIIYQ